MQSAPATGRQVSAPAETWVYHLALTALPSYQLKVSA